MYSRTTRQPSRSQRSRMTRSWAGREWRSSAAWFGSLTRVRIAASTGTSRLHQLALPGIDQQLLESLRAACVVNAIRATPYSHKYARCIHRLVQRRRLPATPSQGGREPLRRSERSVRISECRLYLDLQLSILVKAAGDVNHRRLTELEFMGLQLLIDRRDDLGCPSHSIGPVCRRVHPSLPAMSGCTNTSPPSIAIKPSSDSCVLRAEMLTERASAER
jgi:hypothetical protein